MVLDFKVVIEKLDDNFFFYHQRKYFQNKTNIDNFTIKIYIECNYLSATHLQNPFITIGIA